MSHSTTNRDSFPYYSEVALQLSTRNFYTLYMLGLTTTVDCVYMLEIISVTKIASKNTEKKEKNKH